MSNNKNKKRNTMIGVGVALALTVGVGTYYISQSPDKDKEPTLEDQLKETMANQLFAFTDNGVVKLYDSKNSSELDSFDLKTLATGKEVVVETKPVTPTPSKEPAKVVTEEFGDFLRVPHKVIAGENSWKIQESLTPKRDTANMLKLVAQANGKTKLHPIFPGQTLYYLKEKDGSSPEEAVKEVQTGEAIAEQKVEKVVKKVDENSVYLYSKSEDFKTLYAYSDIEQTFYSVTEKDKKIEAKVLFTATDLKGVKDFKVTSDNKLYVVFEDGTKVREFDLSTNKQTKEYKLQGTSDLFAVRDGFLFYTFADKLGKIDLKNGEEQSVLLGDKSTDFVFTKDKLVILNDFGSKMDNSVLMKINPTDLKVDDLVELKSNENAILSEEVDTETVLVGQISKTTDLDKKVKKEPVVLPIKLSNLQKDLFVKKVPFDKNALEVDGFIYEVKDGTTTVYSAQNGQVSKEIDVDNATKIMPLK
ncbi:hypothetical protein CVD28_04355 [Bacillus sp. M6-12]|uniref:YncE family protein n=1 Tax=Bacillus sp. M6-12 TaxID=2054166 RepID=UPI000C783004|nr:hypothetical protein [Bacillus sp. M6-12]PLS19654.1 hypothetical protein CVD28_04355 [Bacillus sp. M6-12]